MLGIVSVDKVLRFINTFICIIIVRSCLSCVGLLTLPGEWFLPFTVFTISWTKECVLQFLVPVELCLKECVLQFLVPVELCLRVCMTASGSCRDVCLLPTF